MQEIPQAAAERCSGKSLKLQGSSFWPESLLKEELLYKYISVFCVDFKNAVFYNLSQWLFPK